jgi:hypothetical protein
MHLFIKMNKYKWTFNSNNDEILIIDFLSINIYIKDLIS